MTKITILALTLSLSFFSSLNVGHTAKQDFHQVDNNAVAQDGDDSQENGSQGGNKSKSGQIKGENTSKQGDKLPNTSTHYPASILMGLSTFLLGITLFVRRKKVK
ncbi:LPXTG cell wall anchor domain-containing protein [Bacillus clarus]|uniref:LPXTG cell wall anchor domain protein n=1 Tax=Bacillus clarus TaxID=2338372 RepID=A0A090YYX8_9BACI|nr:LPXTG cell wall anchor domain protein [Bacillus clarus]RFT61388.1 LPXTG cell wall anchor domain-containing protein [Bacillus clarus]